MNLQKQDTADIAKGITSEEFTDNLWLIVNKFHARTRLWPLLSYDNAKVHKGANLAQLKYAQGEEDKQVFRLDNNLHKVDLPTYSPDKNRVIEHVFGDAKQRMRVQIYQGNGDYSKGPELQTAAWEVFHSLKRDAVANDTKSLPLLWRVLSTAEGTEFEFPLGTSMWGQVGDMHLQSIADMAGEEQSVLRTWTLCGGLVVVKWWFCGCACTVLPGGTCFLVCLQCRTSVPYRPQQYTGWLLQQSSFNRPAAFHVVESCIFCCFLSSAPSMHLCAGVAVELKEWWWDQGPVHSIGNHFGRIGSGSDLVS